VKTMKKEIIVLLIAAALSVSIFGTGSVHAQGENAQANVTTLVRTLDTSISSLRKGDENGAKTLIGQAENYYENYLIPSGEIPFDNKIKTAFTSLLKENAVEENIFALRADILQIASLPPLYAYSLFIILGIAVMVSLLATLLNKRMVNWDLVRKNKAEIAKYQKELREAMSKRDAKEVHKLQQRRGEISKLQGEMLTQTLKPTIVYIIPMMAIYLLLFNFYSGWVVAWLPFSIDMPFLGRLVAFGVGLWYFITSFGFSQIFRKIMIRD
jgi:uncharacterized membrane protein (DUF106 family)